MEPSRYDIPIGKERAISRVDLARKWGVSDDTAELDKYERTVKARAGTQFTRLQVVGAVRQMMSGQIGMEL